MTVHWPTDLNAFRRDPLNFFLSRGQAADQPLVSVNLTMGPAFLIADPDVARQVLKADPDKIDKGQLVQKLEMIVGKSILTLSGDDQKRRREILHQRLARGAVEKLLPQISAVVRSQLLELSIGGQFEAKEAAKRILMRMASVVLFGERALSRTDELLMISAVDEIERHLNVVMFGGWITQPGAYLATKARAHKAKKTLKFVVGRARAKVRNTTLISAFEEAGLTEAEILDEVVTMLVAGFHTTASSAAWILYLLASNPAIATTVAEETTKLADSTGELKPPSLTAGKISMAFVKEVLRLYPPAWWFSRETMVEQMIGGRKCPKGANLIICPWHLHRDPRFWSQPDEFRLDRSYSNSAFMPFGFGPRVCIGMGAALLELQVLALEVCAAFNLSVVSGESKPQPDGAVVLQPSRVQLDLSVKGGAKTMHGPGSESRAA